MILAWPIPVLAASSSVLRGGILWPDIGQGTAPPPPPPPPVPAETTGTGYLRWRTSTAKFAGAELECGAGIVRFAYRPVKPLPPAWPKPLEEQPLPHPATLTLHTARLEPCCAAVGMTGQRDEEMLRYMRAMELTAERA